MSRWQPSFLAVLLTFAVAGSALGALTYPGPAPCDSTLQACIDGATPGDVVQMATNGPVQGDITIGKSLTIEAATGFTPTIFGIVFILGDVAATSVTLRRLTIHGWVEGQPGSGAYAVHVLDSAVILTTDIREGILVLSAASPPYGDVSVEAARNTIAVAGMGGFRTCGGIAVSGPFDSGTSTVLIAENEVTVTGCGQGHGIQVSNGRGDSMSADIVGNRVSVTNTSGGILVRNFQQIQSTLDARVVSNVITGEPVAGYSPDGISVFADGYEPITSQVINNTVVGRKLSLFARTDLGASIAGVIANNIIVYPNGAGLVAPTELAVSNDHNLVFDSPTEDDPIAFTPGPGTLMQDPLFISATDFHLQAGSPAIDAGNNARVPEGVDSDVEGKPRIVPAGGTVDIGAYENQEATAPTTTTTTSTTTPTTAPTPTPTTTTLPGSCPGGATFGAIACRLDELAADVQGGVPVGNLREKLLRPIGKAHTKLQTAELAGSDRKAKRALGKASGALRQFVARLGSRKAQQTIDAVPLADMAAGASALQAEVKVLRDGLG